MFLYILFNFFKNFKLSFNLCFFFVLRKLSNLLIIIKYFFLGYFFLNFVIILIIEFLLLEILFIEGNV